MDISLIQALLCGLVYYLGFLGNPIFGAIMCDWLKRPIVCGPIVGLILGRPVEGIILGTAIMVPYVTGTIIGGSMPSDFGLAGVVGTALAIASGADTGVAVTIAMSLGLIGSALHTVRMSSMSVFVHIMDKAADEGNLKKVHFISVYVAQFFIFIVTVSISTLAIYYGADVVIDFIKAIDNTPILRILNVLGSLLPALGIGITLASLGSIDNVILCLFCIY